MNRIELIGLLVLIHIGITDAVQGSSSFFQSTISLIGIGVFTIFIGVLLVYSCKVDIKHWKKSIDGRVQLDYPNASLAEFQLPPLYRTPENLVTPLGTDTTKRTDSTQIERTQDEKTIRIVTAMYTSSNRDVPEALQQSLHLKNANQMRTEKTPTTLHTISEKDEEPEISKKSEK